jgi:acetyl esterase/lipase
MNILSRPAPAADHRIPYGTDPSQFGDLWLPQDQGTAHHPLAIFFHGGWWQSEYDLGYAGHLANALKAQGIAVWSVEYRRIGSTGGGWPNTFLDAASATDYAAELSKRYPLDTSRVITMGHSAGGHLAFWVAGRHHIEPRSELHLPRPQLPLRGAIALAGAVDLRLTIELSTGIFDRDAEDVFALMGGTPQQHPERFSSANPGELLPFNIPQILIQGREDEQIPPALPERWAKLATRAGDQVHVKLIPGADHFDVVDPQSEAWPVVRAATQSLLR